MYIPGLDKEQKLSLENLYKDVFGEEVPKGSTCLEMRAAINGDIPMNQFLDATKYFNKDQLKELIQDIRSFCKTVQQKQYKRKIEQDKYDFSSALVRLGLDNVKPYTIIIKRKETPVVTIEDADINTLEEEFPKKVNINKNRK